MANIQSNETSIATSETLPTKPQTHRVRKVIVTLGALIILCLIAYGITLGVSYAQVQDHVDRIQHEEQSLRSAIDAVDIPQANTAAKNLAAGIADLKTELEGWQWSIASALPYYGSSVVAGRQLLAVADSLMQDVVLPTTSIANDYVTAVSRKGILGVFDTELATKVADALTKAAPAIMSANTALDAIQPGESETIRQAVDELHEPVAKAAHILEEYGTLVGHLEGLFPNLKLL